MELQPGDFVYTHHFINDDEHCVNVDGKEVAWMAYNQLFARVRDGEVHMLNDYVLVEPVKETEDEIKSESGLFLKANQEEKSNVGILKYVNSNTEALGANVGDKIYFETNSDYEMDIEGERLFRMKNNDLIYVIKE
jgi:co-chaperonin GroES (HSP10)